MTSGLHLFHKPVGPSSFSVVQACIEAERSLKAQPGYRRLSSSPGAALALPPLALPLTLAGPAPRLFDHLHAIPKVYEATVRWGVETDNGDPLGAPTFTGDTSGLSPQQLDDALATFKGWQNQTPPATSNKRIGGERAYVKAHRGETVILPPSRGYLHEARWLTHDLP